MKKDKLMIKLRQKIGYIKLHKTMKNRVTTKTTIIHCTCFLILKLDFIGVGAGFKYTIVDIALHCNNIIVSSFILQKIIIPILMFPFTMFEIKLYFVL